MKPITLLVALLSLLSLSATSTARLLNVPAEFASIQAGIDASRSGDTVLVQPGVYAENVAIETSGITLTSMIAVTNDPTIIDSTIIDAGHNDCGISVDLGLRVPVLVRGFTVMNGLQTYGGGIDCQNGKSEFEDMVVTNCEAQQWGGGVYITNSSEVTFRRCTFRQNQAAWGAGIGAYLSSVHLQNCAIIGNTATCNGAGIAILAAGSQTVTSLNYVLIAENVAGDTVALAIDGGTFSADHITVVGNRAQQEGGLGGVGFSLQGAGQCLISNSILYDNGMGNLALMDSVTVTYSDLGGGRDSVRANNPEQLVWGDGNIDADPLFNTVEDNNYHLGAHSPCINSGDPEFERDADGSRTDIGALPFDLVEAWIGGRVFDSATNEPLVAAIRLSPIQLFTISDSSGIWAIPIKSWFDSLSVALSVEMPEYCSRTLEYVVHRGDSLWFNIGMDHGEMVASVDSFSVEVDSGEVTSLPLTIRNPGNGPINWSAKGQFLDGASAEPFTDRLIVNVGEITDDDRIEGVAFDGENFFVAGSNGADSSLIYVLNRGGELVRTFEQPTHTRYGFKDLEWDGELLWGGGDSVIVGFDTEGRVHRRFSAGLNPGNNIAYDPDHHLYWVSGTTSNILGYDREGNLQRTLLRKGVRQYGLAWNPDDPEGYHLYILSNPGAERDIDIYKMNIETNDTIKVATLEFSDSMTGVTGAFIFNHFDRYKSLVFAYTISIPRNSGGDILRVIQLQPNAEWLTVEPPSGELLPGGSANLQVNFLTASAESNWAFSLGEYEGEIHFKHDGLDSELRIPVRMTVHPSAGITSSEATTPTNFAFNGAYPNPFNSSTRISFALPEAERITLQIVDLQGRVVETLKEGRFEAGRYSVSWDATGVAAGLYFCKLAVRGQTMTTKLMLVK